MAARKGAKNNLSFFGLIFPLKCREIKSKRQLVLIRRRKFKGILLLAVFKIPRSNMCVLYLFASHLGSAVGESVGETLGPSFQSHTKGPAAKSQ